MSANWNGGDYSDGRYDTEPLLPHEDSPLWLVALLLVVLVVCVAVVPAFDQSQVPYPRPAVEAVR